MLVKDGRITAIGPALADSAPAEVERHDLTGMTLMPGLIDLQVHLGIGMERGEGSPGPLAYPALIAGYPRYLPQARRDLLAQGVTTVRDLGNETPFIFELRDGITDGALEGLQGPPGRGDGTRAAAGRGVPWSRRTAGGRQ